MSVMYTELCRSRGRPASDISLLGRVYISGRRRRCLSTCWCLACPCEAWRKEFVQGWADVSNHSQKRKSRPADCKQFRDPIILRGRSISFHRAPGQLPAWGRSPTSPAAEQRAARDGGWRHRLVQTVKKKVQYRYWRFGFGCDRVSFSGGVGASSSLGLSLL